jgi:predicted transcriptional regulator
LKKRDTLGIISLILEASSADAYDTKKTTVIMYNTLLNHPRLKEYWIGLAEKGLLMYDSALRHSRPQKKVSSSLKSLVNLTRIKRRGRIIITTRNDPFSAQSYMT